MTPDQIQTARWKVACILLAFVTTVLLLNVAMGPSSGPPAPTEEETRVANLVIESRAEANIIRTNGRLLYQCGPYRSGRTKSIYDYNGQIWLVGYSPDNKYEYRTWSENISDSDFGVEYWCQ